MAWPEHANEVQPSAASSERKYFVLSYYDSIAGSYEELYGGEQKSKYFKAVRSRRAGRVLDVGCGVGLLYEYMVERLALEPEIYVGVDLSYESLRVLRSRRGRLGLVEVIAADADRLPLREGSRFTHVYAITVYACGYGDVSSVLRLLDQSRLEEVAVTVLCANERPRCPDGFAEVDQVGRNEVLCVRVVPPGGFEPPTPRSPEDLQPGALPG